MDYRYSLERPWCGSSNKYPQSMFLVKIRKKYKKKKKKSTILNIFIFKKLKKSLCTAWTCFRNVNFLTKLVHILFHIAETQIVELAEFYKFIDVHGVSIQARQFKRRYARVCT